MLINNYEKQFINKNDRVIIKQYMLINNNSKIFVEYKDYNYKTIYVNQ